MRLPDLSKVDRFKRHQKHLSLEDLFPKKNDGLCDCGCGLPLTGRRKRWATKECSGRLLDIFWVIKGNSSEIRRLLAARDHTICASCGINCFVKGIRWDADHIIPVHQGGGGCSLDNLQTLCVPCHKRKTKADAAGLNNPDQAKLF